VDISAPSVDILSWIYISTLRGSIRQSILPLGGSGTQPIRAVVVYSIATTMAFVTCCHLRYVDFESCRVRFAIDPLFN